ncbi:MAG: hypothetical protein IT448_00755 [Phycisphaerales bacterium]|nr:hypothetical protein [Phycisphaerales bacterium]
MFSSKLLALVILAGSILIGNSLAWAEDNKPEADQSQAGQTDDGKVQVKPYPLDMCILFDGKLGSMGDPVVMVYQGQEIKFCCVVCVDPFKKDPEKYLKQMEQAVQKQQDPTTQPVDEHSTH